VVVGVGSSHGAKPQALVESACSIAETYSRGGTCSYETTSLAIGYIEASMSFAAEARHHTSNKLRISRSAAASDSGLAGPLADASVAEAASLNLHLASARLRAIGLIFGRRLLA
jgi:hypothetical protein